MLLEAFFFYFLLFLADVVQSIPYLSAQTAAKETKKANPQQMRVYQWVLPAIE